MLSKLAGQKIGNMLRMGALAGLLVVVAGCGSTPAVQPTTGPTGTIPPITAPTIAPTEVEATVEVASPTAPAVGHPFRSRRPPHPRTLPPLPPWR